MHKGSIGKWYDECRNDWGAKFAWKTTCEGPHTFKDDQLYDNKGNKYGFHPVKVRNA